MATKQELIDRYNAKASKPIKSWKQKLSVLEARVAQLEGQPAEAGETAQAETPAVNPETPEAAQQPDEGTVMSIRKAAKKATKGKGKKTAKRAVKKTSAKASNGSGVGTFVRDLVAKDKGTKEIFEAAVAKGYETTYKSVASMVCRAKAK